MTIKKAVAESPSIWLPSPSQVFQDLIKTKILDNSHKAGVTWCLQPPIKSHMTHRQAGMLQVILESRPNKQLGKKMEEEELSCLDIRRPGATTRNNKGLLYQDIPRIGHPKTTRNGMNFADRKEKATLQKHRETLSEKDIEDLINETVKLKEIQESGSWGLFGQVAPQEPCHVGMEGVSAQLVLGCWTLRGSLEIHGSKIRRTCGTQPTEAGIRDHFLHLYLPHPGLIYQQFMKRSQLS